LFTLGASEVADAEADGAVAASIAGTVAEYELVSARMAALIDDAAQLLDRLAARFAVNFVVTGPRLAFGPAGGAATGVGVALASGAHDPADLAASGLLGAVESAVGRRSASPDVTEPGQSETPRPGNLSGGGTAAAKALPGYGPARPSPIADAELRDIVDQLFRPGASIGRGGTADAVRVGAGHVQKAYDRSVQLGRWLDAAKGASTTDRHIANALLQDLLSALAGEDFPLMTLPW